MMALELTDYQAEQVRALLMISEKHPDGDPCPICAARREVAAMLEGRPVMGSHKTKPGAVAPIEKDFGAVR